MAIKFSYIGLGTPLTTVIDRLLQGRIRIFDRNRQISYVQSLSYGDADKLRQTLNEIDEAVKNWQGQFFISKYENVEASMSQEEMEELYLTERQYLESGKTELTAGFLYGEIERYGFIDEQHRNAVETAWSFNDLEFLRVQWEDAVLEQIRSLRGIVNEMLATVSDTARSKPQTTNRPLKRIEDYPEFFGIDVCCQLTEYSKDTIYKLTANNGIPCCRAGSNGRKLMFKRDDIVGWILNRRQETKEEFVERMDGQLAERFRESKTLLL